MIHLKGDGRDLDFPIEVLFYIAISVVFLMVIALMMKLLWDTGDDGGGARVGETSGLSPSKVEAWFISSYGTNEDDIESNGDKSRTSSSDDLYDGKICVICYDDQRSCLFVPCGHSITCYTCAKRLIIEEMKSCPMCRTDIDKVRKLHIL
ncbi:baculoviral IAP repeat-containing protein 8-like isoform X1 [Salvia splendens]|uniref:baculoviral IAP repeat-containing protein 8-like isoform X1 n=1 Tax=Salvia splendens TaxID=180675 RepID=UPI001C253DEA|nr:baculoviral IAP repeat-containing protein 8-like isoform X1 [Salvia splendens]